MNKKELVNKVACRTDLSKKEIEDILTLVLETIIHSIAKGEKVTLVGFGSFRVKHTKARQARNPKTGVRLLVPAKKIPTFSVGKFFRETVNNSQYL